MIKAIALGFMALSSSAFAQDLVVHPTWMLEPVPGKIYETGIGSPAVAYDRANDLWTMFFETQFGPPDADCGAGRWGIGRATSPDGLSWTIDDELVVSPTPGTYYDCVVAHPDVLFDGTTFRLWFKAQQSNNACPPGAPAPEWGCAAVTGVGYAESTDGTAFTVRETPVINLFSFGFPSVVKINGILRMLLAYSNASNSTYELWESVSTDDGQVWSIPQFVLGPGFATWVDDEIYNPALACDSTPANAEGPMVLFAGGRDIEATVGGPPRIQTAGMGRAWSDDGVGFTWTSTEPLISWDLTPPPGTPPDRDWRHWEAVRVDEDYLFYFSQRDEVGRNRIGLAYTYADVQDHIVEHLVGDRICDGQADTGADATIDDTDVTDTDTDVEDTDTGRGLSGDTDLTETPDKDGCGCAQQGTGAPIAGALLLAALRLRRRR